MIIFGFLLFSVRANRDSKDKSIRRYQQELHQVHEMLESAQKDKLSCVDKMRQIQNEKAALEFDYQWLYDKVSLRSQYLL